MATGDASSTGLRHETVAPVLVHGNKTRAALLPGRPPHGAEWAGPRPRNDDATRPQIPVRAVCCSGGGIRAAAFALGGLQYLNTRPDGAGTVYSRTDLVTSVSGGGYTAGSFALVQHHLDGDEQGVYTPGSQEDNRLRAHTRYLVDSKTQLTISVMGVVYGLVMNLVAILAVVFVVSAGLGLVVGRHLLNVLRLDENGSSFHTSVPQGLLLTIVVALAAGALVYLGYRLRDMYRPIGEVGTKVWCVVSIALIGAGGLCALLLVAVPELLAALNHAPTKVAKSNRGVQTGTLFGTVAALVAIVSQLIRNYVPSTDRTSASAVPTAVTKKIGSVASRVGNAALPWLGSAIIAALLVVALLTWVSEFVRGEETKQWVGTLASLVILLGWRVITDCNRTSLHRPYTLRLASAFGVTRTGADCDQTGDRLSAYDLAQDTPQLVICAAVNTDQPGSTPSGRNCAPFTFSAHTSGISSGTMFNQGGSATAPDGERPGFDLRARETTGPDRVGWNATYRDGSGHRGTAAYDPGLWMRTQDFEENGNLPTIMDLVAVSGAAVAPAMGRMSRPSLRLLLGVANVRLGMWLPNPLYRRRVRPPTAGKTQTLWWQLSQPGLGSLFKEVIGGLTLKRRWVYVTDGGHYENLGLVEALRRGATDIIVFDASGDAPFTLATFGEAVETARADLGVEITLTTDTLSESQEKGLAGGLAARATATYANGVVAAIYLCKAAMTAGMPQDIVAWHGAHADFPNTSTLDQFYGDREFEAYRKLGSIAGRARRVDCDGPAGPGLDCAAADPLGAAAAGYEDPAGAGDAARQEAADNSTVMRSTRHRASTASRSPKFVRRLCSKSLCDGYQLHAAFASSLTLSNHGVPIATLSSDQLARVPNRRRNGCRRSA